MPLVNRISSLFLIVMLIVGPLSHPSLRAAAEDEHAAVWSLIPGSATALITVNTDSTSEQWTTAAANLNAGGLEDLVYGTVADLLASAELPSSLVDPEQSTLMGGAMTVATWGDNDNPVREVALYIEATDPQSAYRTLIALAVSDTPSEVIESEFPGGVASYKQDSDAVVMLLGEIVIVAGSTSADSISRLITGGGPTLDSFDPFHEVMDAQSPDAIARAYLNGPGVGISLGPMLVDLFGLSFTELGLILSLSGPLVTAQSSLGLIATDSGFQTTLAQLPAPFIGQPLPAVGASQDLAEFVSADATFFASGSDLGTNPIFNQLVTVISQAVVGISSADAAGGSTESPLEQIQSLTGIDLQQQLLDQLRGDYLISASAPSIDSPEDLAAVVVSEVVDPTVINGLLRLVRLGLAVGADDQLNGVNWSTREVPGGTFLVFTIDSLLEPINVSVGLINDQLIVAYGDGFTSLLEPDNGDSLADDPHFQEAIDVLPDTDGSIAWLDLMHVIDLSELVSLESSDSSLLPNGPQLAPLDSLHSVISSTYQEDGLAKTDVALVMEGSEPESAENELADLDFVIGSAEVLEFDDLGIISISPTGEYLLVDAGDSICIMDRDAVDAEDGTCSDDLETIDVNHVSWSQDGQRVALTENSAQTLVDSDIWVIDRANDSVTDLTDDGYIGEIVTDRDDPAFADSIVDITPVWSPDGARIAFGRSSIEDGDWITDLMEVDLTSGQITKLGRLGDEPFLTWIGMYWRNDDEILVSLYRVDPADRINGLYLFDLETADLSLIYQSSEDQAAIAVVGSIGKDQVLIGYPYVYARLRTDEICPFAILDLSTGDPTEFKVGDSCVAHVGLSPDGTRAIVSTANGPRLIVLEVATGKYQELDTAPIDQLSESDQGPIPGANRTNGFYSFPWTTGNASGVFVGEGNVLVFQLEPAALED